MKYEDARTIILAAVNERKQWGKHATVRDLPPEFIDALVVYVEGVDSEKIAAKASADQAKAQAKANRQAAAAKARRARAQKKAEKAGIVPVSDEPRKRTYGSQG